MNSKSMRASSDEYELSVSALFRAMSARATDALLPRWIFLRALGLIFFSAFYSLAMQVHGLIGERGILPVSPYLQQLREELPGITRLWYAPSVFWFSAGNDSLSVAVAIGIVCSLLLTANVWPRAMTAICTLLFLSFIATLQIFSSYQSDGMLLEAGFISIWFAPSGFRPGLGALDPPSRISAFMLRWEWFRIYFESGLVKLMSGDVHWRNFTAMDDYYQNGPLPAWPGWYVQQLPHWFHAGTVAVTLVRGARDRVGALSAAPISHRVFRDRERVADRDHCDGQLRVSQLHRARVRGFAARRSSGVVDRSRTCVRARGSSERRFEPAAVATPRSRARAIAESFVLAWIFYATLWAFLAQRNRRHSRTARARPRAIPHSQCVWAVRYDDARALRNRISGEHDGGHTWIAYPFRYKPQDVKERPGIYAPYQPRFDWNLWFASLEPWQESPWVVSTQARLAEGSDEVLALFARDPFAGHPPPMVRTVMWQYWFTDVRTKRETGAWWRREYLGVFAGVVSRDASGKLVFTAAGGE